MSHTGGKKILRVEKKLKQSIRAALIPHGDRVYAGHARYAALRYFKKNTKEIIYLATLHNANSSDTTYILHRDKGFRLGKHGFVKTKIHEHSFDWVHDELMDMFPSAKILALGPNKGVKNLDVWIVHYLNTHKNCIFIATVDLIHYGKKFNNLHYLRYPQQIDKVKKEEELIKALVNPTINLQHIEQIIHDDQNLVDGPKTLRIFMEAMKKMHYKGRVTDYYDSHGNSDLISRYTIDTHPVRQLVSYVSIVYGSKKIDELLPIDILLALGYLKSIILRNIQGGQGRIPLPSWSPLYQKKNGIFMGTSYLGNTNCSYGNFEQENTMYTTTASKIKSASSKCTEDAKNRWKIPYNAQNINQLSYKVEFLDPLPWKSYPGHLAPKKFKNDGQHGIYLELPSGRSATYLPSVFRDNPKWSISKMMDKLTKKAGGYKNEWKRGIFKIYETTSYTWHPQSKTIYIYPPPLIRYSTKSKKYSIRKKYHKKNKTRKK